MFDYDRRKISHGICLYGAPIEFDDDENSYGEEFKHMHTTCITVDQLKQVDKLYVDNPNGYFKLLYDSIEMVNYVNAIDYTTAIVSLACLPILLINIFIQSVIELRYCYLSKNIAYDTKYWSLLFPGIYMYIIIIYYLYSYLF